MNIEPYVPFIQPSTPLLYGSKVDTGQTCMAKYFFRYHLHLTTKTRPIYFQIGSWYHKIVELYLEGSEYNANCYLLSLDAPEDTKQLLLTMFDEFRATWESEDRTVHALERTLMTPVPVPLPNHFQFWCTKADVEFSQDDHLWLGDHKTTSGYGPAVQAYYHKSMQTKTYFTCSSLEQPELYGTKIFATTKQKVRCIEETIVLNETDKFQALTHMSESIWSLTQAELSLNFSRSCSACVNQFGHECEFMPICMQAKMSPAYLEDVIGTWFTIEDPDTHLELTDEQRAMLPYRRLTDYVLAGGETSASKIIIPTSDLKMYPSSKPPIIIDPSDPRN